MKNMSKKIVIWLRNKNQRFRENFCAPIVFKIMDIFGIKRRLPFTCTGDKAQELIYNKLISGQPCMIGRIGSMEIRSIESFINENCSFLKKIKLFLTLHPTGQSKKIQDKWRNLESNRFDHAFHEKFTSETLEDAKELDIFASWRWEETGVFQQPTPFDVVSLNDLEPFFSSKPWTRALAGKKVLVIQPFYKAIEYQYGRRERIFANADILPEFELITYQPFYRGVRENSDGTLDYFRNLECMKKEIAEIEFDIALIAAGPYGFSLAAEIKRRGKQAVVMGGVLQLLFGIRGNRWDAVAKYKSLCNEYWIRPGDEYKPKHFSSIDGGCYW